MYIATYVFNETDYGQIFCNKWRRNNLFILQVYMLIDLLLPTRTEVI